MTDPVDSLIAAVASQQQRNVSRTQLLALGLNRKAIDYRVKVGRLYIVHRGVYSVGKPATTPLERAAAAVLACSPDGFFPGNPDGLLADQAALALWEFARYWPAQMHVVGTREHRHKNIVTHQAKTLHEDDIRVHHGIPVTSAARTMLDCAPTLHAAGKLSRTYNDARLSLYLPESFVVEVCERNPLHPGTRLLYPLTLTTDGPWRSGLERDFPDQCVARGLPRPLMNTIIEGRERDAYFPDERLAVEIDTWATHRSPERYEGDRDRDVDALLCRIETVRLIGERLRHDPDPEFEMLAAALAVRREDLRLIALGRAAAARELAA